MRITLEIDTHNADNMLEAIGLLEYNLIKLIEATPIGQPVKGSEAIMPEPKAETKKTEPKPKAEAKKTEPKAEVKPEPKEEAKTGSVTLAMLKAKAQEIATDIGREEVLAAIKPYASKLAEVSEEDYAKLLKDFEAIGAAK